MQNAELETVLRRVEDAVLLLQGNPYMLAEQGALLQARRRRSPPSARVCVGLPSSVQFFCVLGVDVSCMFFPVRRVYKYAEPLGKLFKHVGS